MNSNFIDLEEINNPIDVNLNNKKSKIDSIKINEKEKHSFNELFSKDNSNKKDLDHSNEEKKELNLNNEESFENIELLNQEKIEEQDIKTEKKGLKERGEKFLKEKRKSKDSIEDKSIIDDKNYIEDNNLTNKANTENINKDFPEIEYIEDVDDIEELETVEELNEEVPEESTDEIIRLTEKISDEQKVTSDPGSISLIGIDKDLLNPDLNIEKSEDKEKVSEEKFGVNRARVFYNIDKEIYSTRSTSIFSKSKLKSIKKGILFPASMASAILFVSFIVIIIMLLFFKSVSASSLEDNIIKDESILAKIAKQMDEERRLAALRLEEERRKLEEDRKRLESAINEELLKKEADIENRYLQRLKELEEGGITTEEKNLLEKEKEEALLKAREERDNKIIEQDRLLAEKDAKIKIVMENLKQESENYEQEIIRIKKEFEEKRKEEERRIEIANQRLNELKAVDEKIAQFNSFIYQLISGAMSEYKAGKIDSATQSLNSVLKYYNSNLDFVLAHDELKNKMDTDVFFVEAISGLIENSKDSILNNREYSRILNKFKRAIGFYNRAENFNNRGEYEKSSNEYIKVLEEFDEINNSYIKLNNNEKRMQDSLGNNYFNIAKKLAGEGKYHEALENLYLIIEKAPLSDAKDLALEEIVNINEILSINTRINTDNEYAKNMFAEAENYKKAKDYENAIKLYDQIILNYPLSEYTKKALEESKKIKETLNQNVFVDQQKGLKEKFLDNYKMYQYYNSRGDFERARIYYFQALKDSFDIFAENSINDFKKEEDKYIELLVKKSFESENNEKAKILFDQAENYKSVQDYENAKKIFDQIVLSYPLSDYTRSALEESKKIKDVYDKDIFAEHRKELKEKFLDNYKMYQQYNSRGDFERARIYYFHALRDSFDIYAENSINDFKKEEDNYIELLVKRKIEAINIDNQQDQQKELKEKFLDHYQKYQYYSNLGDFERARIYYFEALKNSFGPYTNDSIINFKKEEDEYIEDLVKTNLRNKDQYIEYLIDDYNSKIKKIEQEYNELKEKYEELERQYKDNTISKREREKIKKEIEDSIKEKYILLKKDELSKERKKIKNEFKGELYKIKKNIEVNYRS